MTQNTRPNILWVMTDEQRTDSLGCYGSAWAHTPYLDSIAKRGILFECAITPSPVCTPARTSILSGRYPSQHGVWWNHNEEEYIEYLTDYFHQQGYLTMSVGKHHYGSKNQAFTTESNQVLSDHVDYFSYRDKSLNLSDYDLIQYPPEPYPWVFGGRFPGREEETAESSVVGTALHWIDQYATGARQQPFFMRVSFNGPHTPVTVPAAFLDAVTEDDIRYPAEVERTSVSSPSWVSDSLAKFSRSRRLTDAQIRRARYYYYNYVSYIDDQIGKLLHALDSNELLDQTIIVFLSDHGTHLGDYGLLQKQTFFPTTVQVPFIVSFPKSWVTNQRIKTPVAIHSILPTLLDFIGCKYPDDTAPSLLPSLLEGLEPESGPVFSELTLGSFGIRHADRLVMVRDGDWKLTLCLDPAPGDGGLYHLPTDPHELANLYRDPDYRDVVAILTDKILQHVHKGETA